MSKKVLILSSSPRKNGNSDLLCNEFMRGAAEAYGVGAWKVGEINDKPSMHEAYEMGKRV